MITCSDLHRFRTRQRLVPGLNFNIVNMLKGINVATPNLRGSFDVVHFLNSIPIKKKQKTTFLCLKLCAQDEGLDEITSGLLSLLISQKVSASNPRLVP